MTAVTRASAHRPTQVGTPPGCPRAADRLVVDDAAGGDGVAYADEINALEAAIVAVRRH